MQNIGKKLQLKSEQSLLLLNAPEAVGKILSEEGYNVTAAATTPALGSYDAVQLFTKDKEELDILAPQAIAALKPGGTLWIAYPKKSSKIKSDLTRDEGWKTVASLGYSGVRQVAIDATWSSLRFKHASERKEPSKMGVDLPGIDRVARTVVPPEDLQEALKAAGLEEAFEKLSFTQKKECVVAVLEAKRPETRASRIQRTIEQVTL